MKPKPPFQLIVTDDCGRELLTAYLHVGRKNEDTAMQDSHDLTKSEDREMLCNAMIQACNRLNVTNTTKWVTF